MQDYSWQKFVKIHDGIREYLRKHNAIVVAAQYNVNQHFIVYYNNDYDISVKGSYEKELNGEKFKFFHLSSFLLALAYCNMTATDIALTCQFAMNGFDAIISKYINIIKECQTQAGKIQGLLRFVENLLTSETILKTSNKAALICAFNAVRILQTTYAIDQNYLRDLFDSNIDQFFDKDFEQQSEDELNAFRLELLKQVQSAQTRLTREEIKERLDIDYGNIVEDIAKINWKIQLDD